MGFKDYKIRDGVHIPSEKYRENYDAIFKKKKKQADMQSDNICLLYTSPSPRDRG